jgi:16S rRNA C967 or C1407 C5-methylase (RsmB/RsmF family)
VATSGAQAQISKKFRTYVAEHSEYYPDVDAFIAALKAWPVKAVRANTHVTTIEDLANSWNIPCDYVPWCRDSIYFDWDRKVGSTPEHEQGLCYVGDPSAMLPVECIDIASDAFVIDMCAAPGGKTAHVINKLGDGGQLIANDVSRTRARTLQSNIDRLLAPIGTQAPTVEVTNMSSIDLQDHFEGQADVVILDAPCSGEAMMRRSNMARRQWSEKLLTQMVQLQGELLRAAVQLIKPGGQIVYSTCTFNEFENDKVIAALQNVKGLSIQDPMEIKKRLNVPELFLRPNTVSLYPHLTRGDGQTVGVLFS